MLSMLDLPHALNSGLGGGDPETLALGRQGHVEVWPAGLAPQLHGMERATGSGSHPSHRVIAIQCGSLFGVAPCLDG